MISPYDLRLEAAVLRLMGTGPWSIAELASEAGVWRQNARKWVINFAIPSGLVQVEEHGFTAVEDNQAWENISMLAIGLEWVSHLNCDYCFQHGGSGLKMVVKI